MPKHLGSLLVPALALLGACGSPSQGTPTPVAAKPTTTKAEPTKVEPTKVEPTKVEPTKVEPATAEPGSPLRVVAVREGQVLLVRQRDAPLIVIDGEPLTLTDGAFVRHPSGTRGQEAFPGFTPFRDVAAASLPAPIGAWVTTEQYSLRSGPQYAVHHGTGERWRRIERRKGLVTSYYAAYEERDGALLALRSWAPDAEEEMNHSEGPDELAEAYPGKLARAMAQATPAWVRLEGAKTAAVPEIPKGATPTGSAATTTDGTLWALARVESGKDDAPPGLTLLMWPAGQTQAERVDVPGLAEAKDVTVHGSGEWALVAGTSSAAGYLAVGRGKAWERVPVSLAPDAKIPTTHVSAAAREPDGQLWIALAHPIDGSGSGQPVWRKPVDAPWQPVALPEVRGDALGSSPWIRSRMDDEWVAAERPTGALVLAEAPSLVWTAGAIWIVVGTPGEPRETDAEPAPGHGLAYSAVLTTLPGDAPPAVLPPAWQQRLENRNDRVRASKPGTGDCMDYVMVLGPSSLVDPARPDEPPAFVSTIADLSIPSPGGNKAAQTKSVYVAQRGSEGALVAEARAHSPEHAASLRDAVVRAMTDAGVATTALALECTIPAVERMIVSEQPPGLE